MRNYLNKPKKTNGFVTQKILIFLYVSSQISKKKFYFMQKKANIENPQVNLLCDFKGFGKNTT